MLACKNKMFKKFLIFSFIFLFFSICCNNIIHADAKIIKNKTSEHINHVKKQQKKIISSLKKIESGMDANNEPK